MEFNERRENEGNFSITLVWITNVINYSNVNSSSPVTCFRWHLNDVTAPSYSPLKLDEGADTKCHEISFSREKMFPFDPAETLVKLSYFVIGAYEIRAVVRIYVLANSLSRDEAF